jgi:hypothetical protein
MNENFIYIKDNFFSEIECDQIINKFNNNLKKGLKYTGYSYNKLLLDKFVLDQDFLNFFKKIFLKELNSYKKLYPEIDLTASYWDLNELTFKKFNKGDCFSNFHSEHSLKHSNRILSIQVYLSTHKCGTQFYRNKKLILSKKGRLAIFPAYFTHTHKGQVCPENMERFILTGYVNFVALGIDEK